MRPSSVAPPSVLPDISPTRGEIGSSGTGLNFLGSKNLAKPPVTSDLPLVGEMAGRLEGGAKDRGFDCDGC
ncbi:hypothetical protein FJ964_02040 [Mesorhizobium sp. B2-3-2]|nr:hypothetical protein FJ964_02040 [Mesorhizobium sp. B2-3-2]